MFMSRCLCFAMQCYQHLLNPPVLKFTPPDFPLFFEPPDNATLSSLGIPGRIYRSSLDNNKRGGFANSGPVNRHPARS